MVSAKTLAGKVDMNKVWIRLYSELNDFLPPGRGPEVEFTYTGRPTVSEALRALGVPEEAVHMALLEGRQVGLDDRLVPSTRLAVFPIFETFDISYVSKVERERRHG